MPGFDGTGPRGQGPMTGGGRGFCSPWGLGAGVRRYGMPRQAGYGYPYYRGQWPEPWPQTNTEQDLEVLRAQAHELAGHLDSIHRRIAELEKKVQG